MKKISILLISLLIIGLFLVVGCTQANPSNPSGTGEAQGQPDPNSIPQPPASDSGNQEPPPNLPY